MNITPTPIDARGSKLVVKNPNGESVGRVFIYFLKNELHQRPFALMEDLFINPEYRGQGLGTKLVTKMIELAKEKNCYKLIATSRLERELVHQLYQKLGFKQHGVEFRMDL